MKWLGAYRYVGALIVVAALIVGGALIVQSRSPVSPSGNSFTWAGGAPISTSPGTPVPQSSSPQVIAQEVIGTQSVATLSLPPLSTSTLSSSSPTSDSFNYETLLAELSGSAGATTSTTQNNSSSAVIAQAYEFIPTGLVATSIPAKKPMTADQETLYGYGNEVGGEIQSFEALHTNEAEVLKDQAEDRTDPTKAAALVSLGQGLASIGTYMQQMQDVPPDVTSQHNALAQSYLDIGAKLQLVAQAQSDADFVQAVENYDTSANTFVRNYAGLAQYFSEQGVVFAPQDPGSVFSFTDASAQGGL